MNPVVKWRRILCEVACKHRVGVREIMSPDMRKPVVRARDEAMWRIREETSFSLPQIGAKLGRHHTSVLVAIRRHQSRLDALEVAA